MERGPRFGPQGRSRIIGASGTATILTGRFVQPSAVFAGPRRVSRTGSPFLEVVLSGRLPHAAEQSDPRGRRGLNQGAFLRLLRRLRGRSLAPDEGAAQNERSWPGDAEDTAFLEARREGSD